MISNADPRSTLKLLGKSTSSNWVHAVESIPMTGCTVKLNVALRELPDFEASPGKDGPHHRGQINTILTKDEWRKNLGIAQSGQLPEHLWTELYFQSALDDSVVPPGKHVMSVFAQYVPYAFKEGSWDTRRKEVIDLALSSIGRYASNISDVVDHVETMGPPDIKSKIGISGGHIFHGDCLPDHMWTNRLSCRTPMEGVFLCGAGTHPGGGVIGINGRNAAMAVLADPSS